MSEEFDSQFDKISKQISFWAEGGEIQPGVTRVYTSVLRRWAEHVAEMEKRLEQLGGEDIPW